MSRPIKPIAELEQLEELRFLVAERPRDLLLVDIFTQTGLPAAEVLALKAGQVADLEPGRPIPVGGGRDRTPALMTPRLRQTLTAYLTRSGLEGEDWLFKSRKGSDPLSLTSLSHLVRSWYRRAGLTRLTGVKSLRKTWEFHFRPGVNRAELKTSLDARTGFDQVVASTLREKVRSQLVRAIVSGRLAPGQRLYINRIADEMSVSPMPVRDALARLEASGFVAYTASRAYLVRPLAWEQFQEVAELRKLLEPKAARAACRRRPEQTLARLRPLHLELLKVADQSRNQDVDQIMELNRRFHLTLYGGSQMPVLLEVISSLWDKVSPYLYLVARESQTYDLAGSGLGHHRGMLEALEQKDCQALEHWVVTDIDHSAHIALDEFYEDEAKDY